MSSFYPIEKRTMDISTYWWKSSQAGISGEHLEWGDFLELLGVNGWLTDLSFSTLTFDIAYTEQVSDAEFPK